MTKCKHLPTHPAAPTQTAGCEDCLKTGDEWVHLRLCLICGHVGCCNQSKNKHATKHFMYTDHPVIKSFEKGEDWRYCYVEDLFIPE